MHAWHYTFLTVSRAPMQEAFERMQFRDALKAAAYDLGNARDVYRWGNVGDEWGGFQGGEESERYAEKDMPRRRGCVSVCAKAL